MGQMLHFCIPRWNNKQLCEPDPVVFLFQELM